jgi:hypothetical protein
MDQGDEPPLTEISGELDNQALTQIMHALQNVIARLVPSMARKLDEAIQATRDCFAAPSLCSGLKAHRNDIIGKDL